jgi:hypothetical protein
MSCDAPQHENRKPVAVTTFVFFVVFVPFVAAVFVAVVATRRDTALREIARGFLAGTGMTVRGERARVTGLSRVNAGHRERKNVAQG